MQGNVTVVQTLRAALPAEAHLNLQYRMDARLAKFQGYKKIAKKFSRFGDDTHYFLKRVTEQLLFLSGDGGEPTTEYTMPGIAEPPTVPAMFDAALAAERSICMAYENAIPVCVAALDDETRNLYEHLVKWHHDIVRWLEKQQRVIAEIGVTNYLSEKL